MRKLFYLLTALLFPAAITASEGSKTTGKINRVALLQRNSPVVTKNDSLSSLSVGNGGFAFTVDATGLQTFPEKFSNGVPLGTMSDWGWHSFENTSDYKLDDVLKEFDFHGHKELYACQFKEGGRQQDACNYLRVNPHRLHLGTLGFDISEMKGAMPENIKQRLDLYSGTIKSEYKWNGQKYSVATACHPDADMVATQISNKAHTPLCLRFPYATGGHCDDASNWNADDKHNTEIIEQKSNYAVFERSIDATKYFVTLKWTGNAELSRKGRNKFILSPKDDSFSITCEFSEKKPDAKSDDAKQTFAKSAEYWKDYWQKGAMVDFSKCTDPRAKELERRVVLSQYLLAINCAGDTPPQETGLTYNSWYGKFHLEMIWWHQAQFALWNHPEKLAHSLHWYHKVAPIATEIARRQGFDGLRWMKMTDPDGLEAPSNVGSFLIWQQPHLIYLAELLYRNSKDKAIKDEYYNLVQETAKFMYSFADYDKAHDRYVLKGCIPAQETLKAAVTVNPPFELSYWHYAMQVANRWREENGEPRVKEWDNLVEKLSPLAFNSDSLYLAAESATETYSDIRCTSDHPALLGAVGILPMNSLINKNCMLKTLDWVIANWNWNKTWGWDYPMVAMNATRLGEPEKAIEAILLDNRTNTYLVSGHNYQDERLRIYLPGNGGLLTTVALMCAGWDGCNTENPGFPKNGKWNVMWEGLKPMP